MADLQLGLPLLELVVLGLEAVHDLGGPGVLRLPELRDLGLHLLDFGVAFLVLLGHARDVDGEGSDLSVEADHDGVDGHLGERVQTGAPGLHLPRLLQGGLDRDTAGLGLDVVVVELGDGGGDGGDAALRHEEVLALVALEKLVLGLPHARLGGGEPPLQPLVGLARRLHAHLQGLVDVRVGEGVGPERRFLRILVGDGDEHQPALQHGLDLHVREEEEGRFGVVPEGRTVLELQALHHLLGQPLRSQHLELGVVEVGVLPVVPGAHESVRHGHEGGGGRLDLEHGRGPVLRGLDEGDHEAEEQAHEPCGEQEGAAAPDEARVVAEVEVPLVGEVRLRSREHGRAHERSLRRGDG